MNTKVASSSLFWSRFWLYAYGCMGTFGDIPVRYLGEQMDGWKKN
jgi:hypothetical protein